MGGWLRDTPRSLYSRKTDPVHTTKRWVAFRAGQDGCENFAPTGIRSPYRLARSKHYSDWAIPAHVLSMYVTNRPFVCYTQYTFIYTNIHGFRWFKCFMYRRYELPGLYSVCGRWMNNCVTMVEWYWHGVTEVLGENPVPMIFCPTHIHLDWPGIESGHPLSEVCGNRLNHGTDRSYVAYKTVNTSIWGFAWLTCSYILTTIGCISQVSHQAAIRHHTHQSERIMRMQVTITSTELCLSLWYSLQFNRIFYIWQWNAVRHCCTQ